MIAESFHTPANLFKEQHKDKQINHFLQAVPFLSFSDKGLANIAKRFGITVDQLKAKIEAYEAGGRGNV